MKKLFTLFLCLVLCVILSSPAMAAYSVPASPVSNFSFSNYPIVQPDGVFAWVPSSLPSPRMDTFGNFTFSLKTYLKSDLFKFNSGSTTITIRGTSNTGKRLELHLYKLVYDPGAGIERGEQVGNGYYFYDDGVTRNCDFSGLQTGVFYFFELTGTGSTTASGDGSVSHVSEVRPN